MCWFLINHKNTRRSIYEYIDTGTQIDSKTAIKDLVDLLVVWVLAWLNPS